MKVILGGLLIVSSLGAFSSPAVLGPHPYPLPGAVVEEFPRSVHAWHNREGVDGPPETGLHKASHLAIRGPDDLWLDGTVHVGDQVEFLADHPGKLKDGVYKVTTVARWADGGPPDEFTWKFTLKKPAERED